MNTAITTALNPYGTIAELDDRYYQNDVPLNQLIVPGGSLNLNNQRIINLATPTDSADAATKAYVDAVA